MAHSTAQSSPFTRAGKRASAVGGHHRTAMFIPGEELLSNRWQSVIHDYTMWPGEYQSARFPNGNFHVPWGGMNMAYFECCTGTPCGDAWRASAFVATELFPDEIAQDLVRSPSLQGRQLQVEVGPGRK